MKKSSLQILSVLIFVFLLTTFNIFSQDTFSIVAVNPETGEVGSAGASCVDLSSFPGLSDDFLGELFPGFGAINTQAWYNQTNQINARNRMNAGDTPDEIIDWLINNDVSGQSGLRQYGIAALIDGGPQTAAHTGASTDDYKNHITGPNYSIQGNILLGQEVLDSMESRFLKAEGDLACKLMAALQGANMIGADSRCTPNGTSSLFAFIKVAQPDDTFGNPSFVQSVRTSNGAGIEPIDALQTLFNNAHSCDLVGTDDKTSIESLISIYPVPMDNFLTVESKGSGSYNLEIFDLSGNIVYKTTFRHGIVLNLPNLPKGIYFVRVSNERETFISKIIKK